MTQEKFERAKEIERETLHISKVIEFIEGKKCPTSNALNIFITDEIDDFVVLNNTEIECIIDALNNKKCALEYEFGRL